MAELADAPDLGSGAARLGGSSPPFRIFTSPSREVMTMRRFPARPAGCCCPWVRRRGARRRPHPSRHRRQRRRHVQPTDGERTAAADPAVVEVKPSNGSSSPTDVLAADNTWMETSYFVLTASDDGTTTNAADVSSGTYAMARARSTSRCRGRHRDLHRIGDRHHPVAAAQQRPLCLLAIAQRNARAAHEKRGRGGPCFDCPALSIVIRERELPPIWTLTARVCAAPGR